ncbi:hypothetical protein GCM10022212_33460 [Actimicrobium antarcticum]|uniref:Uncharacterized protein n=2 Tax=Actimicrobium antarcticum TaxID=1051899 RepID=A0ABP7TVM6_9BURK
MNQINNFHDLGKIGPVGKTAIRVFSVSHKAAGTLLANYEKLHGAYSLRQAESLRHATYRDASRLDGCDLIEGLLWILPKASERAAVLVNTSKEALPCNEAAQCFWLGLNGLVGDSGEPIVLKVGANTRVWVPKA